MRPAVRRSLCALGAVTAAAAWVLGQGGAVASATSAGQDGLAHTAAAAHLPQQEILRPGMHGPAVRKMQRRLTKLHYYPGPVNGSFGTDTVEAVWAFKEVQSLQTKLAPNEVGQAMQRSFSPGRCGPRSWRGRHPLSPGRRTCRVAGPRC